MTDRGLPDQHPTPPPRYRFRPRNDRGWRLPEFRDDRGPRLDAQRFETYEPEPFEWSELNDPVLWVAGAGTVIGLGLILAFWFTA